MNPNYLKFLLIAAFGAGISLASAQQLESTLFQNWVSGKWQNHQMNEYSYDGTGKMITDHMHNWDAVDKDWQNSFTYDCDGSVSTQLFQSFDSATGNWNNESIYTYTYAANGKVAISQYQVWMNNAWEDELTTTNSYDEKDNLASFDIKGGHYFTTYSDHNAGKPTTLSYDYNPDGTIIMKTVRSGSYNDGLSHIASIYSYTYSDGHLATAMYEDCGSGDCQNRTYDFYAYDEAGTMIADTTKIWDGVAEIWINSTLITYTKNTILTRVWTADGWANSSLATFTYSAGGIALAPSIVSGVYPNPATDVVNVNMVNSSIPYDLYLTDMTGKEVLTKINNTGAQDLDVSRLTDGVYLLSIRQNGISTTQKIVK